jgi:hypothetical protein
MAAIFHASRDIRQDLEPGWRADLLDPDQVNETRYETTAVAGRSNEVINLVSPGDFPLEVDSPPMGLLALEPKLGVGDSQLGAPAQRVATGFAFPHAIPGVAVPIVVVEGSVVERTRSVDAEEESGTAIVIAVQKNDEPVGAGDTVAAGELGSDRIRSAVEHAGAYIQRVIVVQNVHFGPLGRVCPFDRLALSEVGDWLRGRPHGFG